MQHPEVSGNFETLNLQTIVSGDTVVMTLWHVLVYLRKKAWQRVFVLSFLAKIIILLISITCFMVDSPILMLPLVLLKNNTTVRLNLHLGTTKGTAPWSWFAVPKNHLMILSPKHVCQLYLHQGLQGRASNHDWLKILLINQDTSSALSSRPNLGPRAKEKVERFPRFDKCCGPMDTSFRSKVPGPTLQSGRRNGKSKKIPHLVHSQPIFPSKQDLTAVLIAQR